MVYRPHNIYHLSHTHLDLLYSVNVLSQFMHSPQQSQFQAVHRVLRYLKGTGGLGLSFVKTSKIDLTIYTNSDCASSLVDRKSTTSYCKILGENLLTWRCKK